MPTLTSLVADLRTIFGRPAIDPIDASAPAGTIERRIAAHNALIDLARPGQHRYCGLKSHTRKAGPCILVEGHSPAKFDVDRPRNAQNQATYFTCMDVEQRDRAERYLVHSEPDPERRA